MAESHSQLEFLANGSNYHILESEANAELTLLDNGLNFKFESTQKVTASINNNKKALFK